MSQTIVVSGYRQTGKTEKIVWMVVGGILAGARPCVAIKDLREAEHMRRRILAALAQIGQDTPKNNGIARGCCKVRGVSLVGHHDLFYQEVTYDQ